MDFHKLFRNPPWGLVCGLGVITAGFSYGVGVIVLDIKPYFGGALAVWVLIAATSGYVAWGAALNLGFSRNWKAFAPVLTVVLIGMFVTPHLRVLWNKKAFNFTAGISAEDRAKLDSVIYDESQWPIRLRYTLQTPRSADYTRLVEAYIDKKNPNTVYSRDSDQYQQFYGLDVSSGMGATVIRVGVKKYKD